MNFKEMVMNRQIIKLLGCSHDKLKRSYVAGDGVTLQRKYFGY